jgi:uncharacterized protein YkwD
VTCEPAPPTEATTAVGRVRRWFAVLATSIGVGLLSGAVVACTTPAATTAALMESTPGDRAAVRDLVNVSRAQNRLGQLAPNPILDLKADLWAQYLRGICALKHSRLADGAPPGWRKLGENVGKGGTIPQIHDAYLRSPSHRANILDPFFTQIGTAAVWGNCGGYRTVFTVQEFMK